MHQGHNERHINGGGGKRGENLLVEGANLLVAVGAERTDIVVPLARDVGCKHCKSLL